MEETILTKHPHGKRGFRISRHKYEIICHAILESLKTRGDSTHTELTRNIKKNLRAKLEGSILAQGACPGPGNDSGRTTTR